MRVPARSGLVVIVRPPANALQRPHDDISTQAITQSLQTVHEFQYIYDLSKSPKTDFLREYGLLYGPETPKESPITCQKMFLMDTATPNNPPLFPSFRHTNRQPQCAVTRGKTLQNS